MHCCLIQPWWLSSLMGQFSHSVDAAHLGGRWIESRLGRKCLYGRIYQILLAVDNSSPAIYIYTNVICKIYVPID